MTKSSVASPSDRHFPVSALLPRLSLVAFFLAAGAAAAFAGWSVDTSAGPEESRELFARPGSPPAPRDSWLRIRGMVGSGVRDSTGAEIPLGPGIKVDATIAERRAALAALRERGYRLVAPLQWSSDWWVHGVRSGQRLRRLPVDLREIAARCRQLAETYGDLIDIWEIENEPDISFVEENPETYAAFLKACYLGFKSGTTTPAGTAQVLNAAFALPPGPYFNSWAANDGLRYTDGFNYHFYGYAEDFTGVYRQFEDAVLRANATPADESVFSTFFYPPNGGWKPRFVSRFAANEGDTATARATLQARPLGTHEPALESQGRWLVSAGTTVRETAEGWEFSVTRPAPGPRRPPMAELPLPAGWRTSARSSLVFEYSAEGAVPTPQEAENGPHPDPIPSGRGNPSATIRYPATPPPSLAASGPIVAVRKLPVFLTEYGFSLLEGEARRTAGGRETQRAWFESAESQMRGLGIARALAFNFKPDYTDAFGEFGLLMSPESGPGDSRPEGPRAGNGRTPAAELLAAGFSAKGYAISPAFSWLLAAGERPIEPRDWPVTTHPPTSVVIDFIADQNLTMNKTSCGYVLSARPAPGNDAHRLVLYNLGAEPVAGDLLLDGPWTLGNGGSADVLQLAPGERREIAVEIRLVPADYFGAQRAGVRFKQHNVAPAKVTPAEPPPLTADSVPPPVTEPGRPATTTSPAASPASPTFGFEAYIRTANGNLYQTWPRLNARETWQWYVERFANFTPAFYGRAHLPTALAENEPAALVFFFRPEHYPATYRLRRVGAVEFQAR